ncbi:peptidase M28 [Haloferula helveola]|uniref:Peptidase M28 n=1 Tax=Haloferula helveola TaxID=490095 RepID=A0ABN6GYC9_9BACT|nr:peptidase M28 [Haloferula helveola]
MKPAAALLLPLACLAGVLSHCSKPKDAGPEQLQVDNTKTELSSEFSGANAFAHVERIVGYGPRPPASEGFEKMLSDLEKSLADFGWKTTRQKFRAATPDGPVDFTNLLARHGSAKPEPDSLPFIIGGHIDTKKFSFPFVGANDGGSSTGVLLELARVLSTDPASAAKVELVFFDGEEAFRPGITATDGLYGSKYFAQKMATRPTWPAAGIVIDIVGDPDYELHFNPETPEGFASVVERLGAKQNFTKPFKASVFPVIDDHVPLQNAGVPCLHLIGQFGSMPYWHKEGDTLDKVKPEMLEKVGRLVLDFLAEAPQPAAASAEE